MKHYKYICWDLDGTITNTYEGISKCLNYAVAPFGYEVTQEQEIRKFIGPPLRDSLPQFLGMNKEDTEEAIRLYRERYIPVGVYECELFPGIREALTCFREAGRIQLVTSCKPEAQCHQVLGKFDLEQALDHIVGATPDGRIDEKHQVLEEAFRRLKLEDPEFDKSQVVLIGDTKYDAQGAAQVGIDCIGISYGFGTVEELWEHGVVAVYDDLATLTEALCSNRR